MTIYHSLTLGAEGVETNIILCNGATLTVGDNSDPHHYDEGTLTAGEVNFYRQPEEEGKTEGKLISKAAHNYFAGIGSYENKPAAQLNFYGGQIISRGGTVTANGGECGAGIGGGYKGQGTDIDISGGTIEAAGGAEQGAGIGGGDYGASDNITI